MTIRIDGTNSAANPGITGSDTDTGLQFGTDEVNIVTGGTSRATVDSSGRLLVGATSTTLNHPIQVVAPSDANAIAIIGRALDDIGELSFYENDQTTKLGELQYRQDHLNFRHRVGDIRFATGGVAERMRILSNGGLTFNGDTAAANALDDYEEGTWTPSGEFTVNGTRTNVDMRGSYTKVGDVVTINFYTQVTKGTASGLYEIHGLPFTASSKTYSMAIPLGFGNMNVTNPLFGSLVSGNTKLVILQADANPPTNVEASDMNTSNAVVNGTFVYYAS